MSRTPNTTMPSRTTCPASRRHPTRRATLRMRIRIGPIMICNAQVAHARHHRQTPQERHQALTVKTHDAPDTTSTDRIEKDLVVRAPRSRVWRALANAKEFGTWFRMNLDGEFAE